jgi:hypothetical protein
MTTNRPEKPQINRVYPAGQKHLYFIKRERESQSECPTTKRPRRSVPGESYPGKDSTQRARALTFVERSKRYKAHHKRKCQGPSNVRGTAIAVGRCESRFSGLLTFHQQSQFSHFIYRPTSLWNAFRVEIVMLPSVPNENVWWISNLTRPRFRAARWKFGPQIKFDLVKMGNLVGKGTDGGFPTKF